MAPKRKPKDESPAGDEAAPKKARKPRTPGTDKGAWTESEV